MKHPCSMARNPIFGWTMKEGVGAAGEMVTHHSAFLIPTPRPSFSRLQHYGKSFTDHCCGSCHPHKAPCLPFHPHCHSFIQCQLSPGRGEIKYALEMPEIAGDQDVPGSRQPQKQDVAGLGWSPANSPPAHGAGLSHGPAWTDGCREGHVDPKETQKPQWCLCTLWWMKFESTSSSSKRSHQPLSAIHCQPWPEATQHLGEMWGSAPLNRCWRAAALSIHRPGMDLEPGGERLPISHPKNYRFLIKKTPDFPRLCVYTHMQRIMQYRRQEDIGVCKVSEALGVTHSPAGRSQMRLLLQHKHSPHRVLPILLNSCGLLE